MSTTKDSIQKIKDRLKREQLTGGGYLPRDKDYERLRDFIEFHQDLDDYILKDAIYNQPK